MGCSPRQGFHDGLALHVALWLAFLLAFILFHIRDESEATETPRGLSSAGSLLVIKPNASNSPLARHLALE